MKRRTLRQRGIALLIALALMVAAAPAALAANTCPQGGGAHTVGSWEVIRKANCHEVGTRRGICTKCNQAVYEDIPLDASNHDAICTDNGDGLTHTATCVYHPAYANIKEPHTFENGRCTKCMAVDYSAVTFSVPKLQEVYVSINDTAAALSVGDVKMTIGAADVTDEYNLSYNWYYQGSPVGTGDAYQLPAASVSKEADYEYVCFIMATPKKGSTKSISASYTVTVHVRDLVEAYAAVSTDDIYFPVTATNSRTPSSIADQIYQAVYDRSDTYPSHVVFNTKPASKVGNLTATAQQPYYFTPMGNQAALERLQFEPSRDKSTGTYVINFTAYDVRGKAYPGTLTIAVEQSLGSMDVLYTTAKGTAVNLAADDFEDFWQRTYAQGMLTLVRFTGLPTTTQGALYCGYTSASRPGLRVKSGESFYTYANNQNQYLLDDLTFVPSASFTGYVSIPFEAYGQNNRGTSTYLSGSLFLLVSDGAVRSVSYQATAGGSVTFNASDFLSVYQAATGSKGTGFYIQLLEVPTYGSLYVNYTGGIRDMKLTSANVSSIPFYYSNSRAEEIGDLTYVAGTGVTDTLRYVAYDTKGTLLYVGTVTFSKGEFSVSYTAGSTGVGFASSDFEKALGLTGTTAAGTYLTFSPPTSGTLTYTKTGTGGTAITANDKFYLGTDLISVSNLLYTPKTGQSGLVSIPFTAYLAGGGTVSGAVKITVRAATYTKSFTDVKSTDWFYTYVMDLAQAGIINGMTPTTYSPGTEVTYGQALKLIMMATGYSDLTVKTAGKHWASEFLAAAQRDGILPVSVTTSYLDRKIPRYTIAEIAAKAMKLPQTTLKTSPFSDMAMTVTSAPYVLALYEAKIVEGTTQTNGTVKYYGVNSITRAEMATIVWRINNYNK